MEKKKVPFFVENHQYIITTTGWEHVSLDIAESLTISTDFLYLNERKSSMRF